MAVFNNETPIAARSFARSCDRSRDQPAGARIPTITVRAECPLGMGAGVFQIQDSDVDVAADYCSINFGGATPGEVVNANLAASGVARVELNLALRRASCASSASPRPPIPSPSGSDRSSGTRFSQTGARTAGAGHRAWAKSTVDGELLDLDVFKLSGLFPARSLQTCRAQRPRALAVARDARSVCHASAAAAQAMPSLIFRPGPRDRDRAQAITRMSRYVI